MENVSPSSPRKGLKILIAVAIVSAILFAALFGVLWGLRQEKSMYAEFSAVIADASQSNYNESWDRLNAIDAKYPYSLTDFTTTSNALQARLNYYLPYLVHLKFDVPTRNKAQKMLKTFSSTKLEFETMLEETWRNAQTSGDNANKQAQYFANFLPTYCKYISAKYDVVQFIEAYFNEVGFAFSPYLTNLNRITYIYIDFAINIGLPSVCVDNLGATLNTNNFSKIISDASGENSVSLRVLNQKFDEFKNTFKNNTSELHTNNFSVQVSVIEKSFKVVLNAYKSLREDQQKAFLAAKKVKPATISTSSANYVTEFLLSYFAVEDGTFRNDLNSQYVRNYFEV